VAKRGDGHDRLRNIVVAPSVTLAGGQPCPTPTSTQVCGGHDAQHPGPRLYTTSRPHGLLNLSANVHLSGFRLEGPHQNPTEGDDNLEHGIYIENGTGIDIGNMDISGFSGSAVFLTNEGYPAQQFPSAVRVHDNYIHNNQHIGGDGYGVDVNHGANVWVEHNTFDFNRHAISAGKPDTDTGYTAIDNLVLKGGGYHGTFFETWTQQFDIHGDSNCWDVFQTGSLWNCGHAGDRYDIRNNVFQYTNGLSFKAPRHTRWRRISRAQYLSEGRVRFDSPERDRHGAWHRIECEYVQSRHLRRVRCMRFRR
jgi:hypothetical protein